MPVPAISVCICTFRRPDLLRRSLDAVARQRTGDRFSVGIVVADNDAAASARSVVAAFAESAGFPVIYRVQPRQNISLARNTALEAADGDYIAFIDDDEFPDEEWLLRMLENLEQSGADGVLGPVRPFFDTNPPAWLVRGNFCGRPEHTTGLELDWKQTRTGNVLFRRAILKDEPVAFRPEFGNGGEDQDFFRRMMARGRRFVWCNEAVVYEVVPPERSRRRYFLKRALLRGQNEKLLLTVPSVVKSVLAVPVYLASLPVMLVLGQDRFMRSAIRLMDHSGKLLAAMGVSAVRGNYLNG